MKEEAHADLLWGGEILIRGRGNRGIGDELKHHRRCVIRDACEAYLVSPYLGKRSKVREPKEGLESGVGAELDVYFRARGLGTQGSDLGLG